MINPTQSCFLVDGSSFFYRAFHALPPLVNSKGQATGAIYGVASMLKKLIQQYQPQYIAVIFDAPGKTFRQDIYPEYKAHRPPTPPELKSQYQPLVTLITALGLPVFAIPGVEADDVIGSLAHQATQLNIPSTIVTSDKDFAQLVSPHVQLYNSMSEQWLDSAGIFTKYGIHPEQFQDYLCLIGDSSDNIPGVAKCGPKTATKWLSSYGNLDNLIAHADEISGKVGEYLRAGIDFFAISKALVKIDTQLDLPIKISDLKPQPANQETILALAQELEFKSWIKTPSPQKLKTQVQIIQDIPALAAWLAQLSPQDILTVDTETSGLDPLQAQLIGISLCSNDLNTCYIPLAHHEPCNCPSDEALALLKPILENPRIKKLGQNFKYDLHIFAMHGIDVQGFAHDTMLESYILNSTASRHDLGSLAKYYLHLDSISYEDVTGKGVKQRTFAEVSIPDAAAYSGEDVLLTLKLHQHFLSLLSPLEQKILDDIEIPTAQVLRRMESHGVAIDPECLKRQGEQIKLRLETLLQQAWSLAGTKFNLQSPKQLATILYENMQLPIISKTPSGQASTADEVLQTLALDYPLPAIIIEYRGLSKLLSTYIEGLPKWINPHTQRIHTSYNQAITATGRLSSTEPNLQNIPIRTHEGRQIRKAFIAREEHLLLTADYSQVELRLMAHFSKDPGLTQAFLGHLDVHQATAAEIFAIPLAEVTPDQRREAKTINFGLIYGMSAFGLARQLKISRPVAQAYIERYFHHYPGVLTYMETAKAQAHQHGYVETLSGRRLYLPDIHNKNMAKVKAAERIAINAPLQGTAAELIKIAMIQLDAWLEHHPHIRAKMIMQVHDELVFEVHQQDIDAFKPVVQSIMEAALPLSIPLTVNLGQGLNWEEAHS